MFDCGGFWQATLPGNWLPGVLTISGQGPKLVGSLSTKQRMTARPGSSAWPGFWQRSSASKSDTGLPGPRPLARPLGHHSAACKLKLPWEDPQMPDPQICPEAAVSTGSQAVPCSVTRQAVDCALGTEFGFALAEAEAVSKLETLDKQRNTASSQRAGFCQPALREAPSAADQNGQTMVSMKAAAALHAALRQGPLRGRSAGRLRRPAAATRSSISGCPQMVLAENEADEGSSRGSAQSLLSSSVLRLRLGLGLMLWPTSF